MALIYLNFQIKRIKGWALDSNIDKMKLFNMPKARMEEISTNILDIGGLCAFAFPRNPLTKVVLGKLQ
jgi:hypothetical protein